MIKLYESEGRYRYVVKFENGCDGVFFEIELVPALHKYRLDALADLREGLFTTHKACYRHPEFSTLWEAVEVEVEHGRTVEAGGQLDMAA